MYKTFVYSGIHACNRERQHKISNIYHRHIYLRYIFFQYKQDSYMFCVIHSSYFNFVWNKVLCFFQFQLKSEKKFFFCLKHQTNVYHTQTHTNMFLILYLCVYGLTRRLSQCMRCIHYIGISQCFIQTTNYKCANNQIKRTHRQNKYYFSLLRWYTEMIF